NYAKVVGTIGQDVADVDFTCSTSAHVSASLVQGIELFVSPLVQKPHDRKNSGQDQQPEPSVNQSSGNETCEEKAFYNSKHGNKQDDKKHDATGLVDCLLADVPAGLAQNLCHNAADTALRLRRGTSGKRSSKCAGGWQPCWFCY